MTLMTQKRGHVKGHMSAYFAIYLQLLLFALYQQPSLAQFEGCDYDYYPQTTSPILQSPYYPNKYPPYTACRYKFTAPKGYTITATCEINLPKNPTSCATETFYIAVDGDKNLRNSEEFCGYGIATRTSVLNTMTFAYYSQGASGTFTCNITFLPCDCGWSVNTRIKNGQEANINEFPSMVAIKDRYSSQQAFCGGSIITQRFILTAAHCAYVQKNPYNLIIIAGDHDLASGAESIYTKLYGVEQIIPHPKYDAVAYVNDIALLRTDEVMQWSRGLGPICLPAVTDTFTYQTVTTVGWGTNGFGGQVPTKLQKAYLLVSANGVCQERYADFSTIYESHICTYDYNGKNVDTCQYDSGGPVILQNARQYLIGVISYGRGCGSESYSMGVNSRITSHMNWIREVVESTADQLCDRFSYKLN